MIRIKKTPSIQMLTDRWGAPTGEYYVDNTVGYVDERTWEFIQNFEEYSQTEQGKTEREEYVKELQEKKSMPPMAGYLPLMTSLIERSKGLLYQFNLQLDNDFEKLELELENPSEPNEALRKAFREYEAKFTDLGAGPFYTGGHLLVGTTEIKAIQRSAQFNIDINSPPCKCKKCGK